jgi:hypothetical protein
MNGGKWGKEGKNIDRRGNAKWAKKHYEKEGEKSGEMPMGKEIVQMLSE